MGRIGFRDQGDEAARAACVEWLFDTVPDHSVSVVRVFVPADLFHDVSGKNATEDDTGNDGVTDWLSERRDLFELPVQDDENTTAE